MDRIYSPCHNNLGHNQQVQQVHQASPRAGTDPFPLWQNSQADGGITQGQTSPPIVVPQVNSNYSEESVETYVDKYADMEEQQRVQQMMEHAAEQAAKAAAKREKLQRQQQQQQRMMTNNNVHQHSSSAYSGGSSFHPNGQKNYYGGFRGIPPKKGRITFGAGGKSKAESQKDAQAGIAGAYERARPAHYSSGSAGRHHTHDKKPRRR